MTPSAFVICLCGPERSSRLRCRSWGTPRWNKFVILAMHEEERGSGCKKRDGCVPRQPSHDRWFLGFELSIRFTSHGSKESIALSGNRLDVAWTRAPVAENGSQTVHQNVEAVFELQLAVWPQVAFDLIASNQLAGTTHQENEQIERLSRELDRVLSASKPSRSLIQLELAEDSDHAAAGSMHNRPNCNPMSI